MCNNTSHACVHKHTRMQICMHTCRSLRPAQISWLMNNLMIDSLLDHTYHIPITFYVFANTKIFIGKTRHRCIIHHEEFTGWNTELKQNRVVQHIYRRYNTSIEGANNKDCSAFHLLCIQYTDTTKVLCNPFSWFVWLGVTAMKSEAASSNFTPS